MPPKPTPINSDSPCAIRGRQLTLSELKVLFGALNALCAPLEIDVERAADFAGLKPNSFKEMFRQLRKKYEFGNPPSEPALAPVNSKKAVVDDSDGIPAKKRGRGRPPKAMLLTPLKKRTAGEAELEEEETPTKKPAMSAADEAIEEFHALVEADAAYTTADEGGDALDEI